MDIGVRFDALRAEKLETDFFSAEIGDGLLPVLGAWDVALEVGFHIF